MERVRTPWDVIVFSIVALIAGIGLIGWGLTTTPTSQAPAAETQASQVEE